MTSRRNFLASSSALFATWAMSTGGCTAGGRPKFAKHGKDLKFIFVVAEGGWDPTQVFAVEFGKLNVDMPVNSEKDNFGRVDFVNIPGRPAVEDFFRNNARRSLIVNGILVPSLAHDVCTKLVMTGTTADGKADMAAIIGGSAKDDFQLPHAVLGGAPLFSGDFGTSSTRMGGGLNEILDGSVLSNNDFAQLNPAAKNIIEKHVRLRAQERAQQKKLAERSQRFLELYSSSLDRAKALQDVAAEINFNQGGNLAERATLAVQLLQKQVSRVVTLSIGGWDTHSDNDAQQLNRHQDLFTGLNALATALKETPGVKESSMEEETVVVVVSEMGRTPLRNGANGKDHWAYTSALLFGPGITQNRVIGGFDDGFNGATIDYRSGDITERGKTIAASNFCASLLNMAGIDHKPLMPGISPVTSMID
jgi:hypothetical protein